MDGHIVANGQATNQIGVILCIHFRIRFFIARILAFKIDGLT